MPCKRAFSQAGIRETVASETKKAKESEVKTTEAHESTRQRIESVTKRMHVEHIAGEGQNSILHYNLVHKFISDAASTEYSRGKGSSGQGMEKTWDNSRMGCEKSQEQKGGHRRGTEKQQQSSLCFIDGRVSEKEFGVGATIPEVQRSSCTSRRHCERRLWSLCSVYWTGLIGIANDGRKSNGCYCSTTRLWRTSNWRSIGAHPGKNGGCSKAT